MKCMGLLILLICLGSASANFQDKLLETFEDASENDTLSEACQEALYIYVSNLNNTDDMWALKMFDSGSKIPVGLLSYNFGELGQFNECLDAESADGTMKSRYCLGAFSLSSLMTSDGSDISILENRAKIVREMSKRELTLQDSEDDIGMALTWALCLPRACTDEDAGAITKYILLGSNTVHCKTKEDLYPPLTNDAIAAIIILSFVVLLLIVSTIIDLYYSYTEREPPSVILISFSLYTNGRKLFRISKNPHELSCVNGIRFISILMVIIGHIYSTFIQGPIVNFKEFMEWTDCLRSMTIVAGTFAVDTFLVLSGLLVVYTCMKARHYGINFNIFHFYIHRYLRLTPALAATILVVATLMKYMGTGPLWHNTNYSIHACRKWWWASLLYIQNYADDTLNYCLPQTWYLSVDTQLYIIAPILLFLLFKYARIGVGVIITCTLAIMATCFAIGYTSEIPVFLTNFEARVSIVKFTELYYMKTHTRSSPWFIGLLLGYVLAKMKFQPKYKNLRINKVLVLILWAICIAAGAACIFGGHSTLRGHDYSVWGSSSYLAFVRPTWALCLSWVIFACVTGYGGIVNRFLSMPIFQVLGRFTYSVYLIHYPLLIVYMYNFRIGIYFDELTFAYSFWGIAMISFALSTIWVLAFESPVVAIEKLIFKIPPPEEKTEQNGSKIGPIA